MGKPHDKLNDIEFKTLLENAMELGKLTLENLRIFGHKQVAMIIRYLENNSSLKILSFVDCITEANDMDRIMGSLKPNTGIEDISFTSSNGQKSRWQITTNGGGCLSEFLKNDHDLKKLTMSNVGITKTAAGLIGDALKVNKSLVYLNLTDAPFIGKDELDYMAEALQKNKIITSFYANSDHEGIVEITTKNKAYVKSFSAYWKANQNKEIKLNLGDIKYFLGCDKELLKQNLEDTPDIAWNKGQIMKFWQDNAFVILGICKNAENQLGIPKEITSHIFSFLSPYDFATEDFVKEVDDITNVGQISD